MTVSHQSEDTVHKGRDGTAHTVRALAFNYRYELAAKDYVSGGLSFTKNEVDVTDVPAFLHARPVGKTLTVYVNPTRPDQAVMERGVPTIGILFMLMPAVFVRLGPFLVWGSISGAIVRFCERPAGAMAERVCARPLDF